jgi:hypothetical protein
MESNGRTYHEILRDGTVGSFWNPRVLSSLWQDTAGTIPAVVDSEVKRMDDLGTLGNHMTSLSGTRLRGDHTYVLKGPTLKREGNQYYLQFDGDGAGLVKSSVAGNWPELTATSTFGMTLSVAFQTDSIQPPLPTTGFSGTWLGNDALGNFGGVWFFGLRLASENMFYATLRKEFNHQKFST